jgi:peptide/nickel transport system ATP-binding protein
MISIKDLCVAYHGEKRSVEALRGVSLDVRRGEVVSVVGESGSGKSTLLLALLRLLPYGTSISGQVFLDDKNALGLSTEEFRKLRWRKISLVPQGSMNALTPVITIGSQIAEPMEVHLGLNKADAKRKAASLLEEVELPANFSSRYPHQLSGGQRQRAAIAMALACNPNYLLADEPTTALDVIVQAEITKLLLRLVIERDMGLLLVTHDLPLASGLSDRIAVMHDGTIVEQGEPLELIESPRHHHTKVLIAALKKLEVGP